MRPGGSRAAQQFLAGVAHLHVDSTCSAAPGGRDRACICRARVDQACGFQSSSTGIRGRHKSGEETARDLIQFPIPKKQGEST